MKRPVFFLALVALAACARSPDPAPVSLSESDRAIVGRLESARDRLVAAISELQIHPERRRYLCNAQLAGTDPYLGQNLKSVAGNPDKLDYLRKIYFRPEQLETIASALAGLKFRTSDDPKDLELNEVGMDAFAIGHDITVGAAAFRTKTDDQILGVVGHELRHALGELDVGRAGPFGDRASAIDGSSACLFSLVAGVESRAQVVQWEQAVLDDFTRPGSFTALRALEGEWDGNDNGYFFVVRDRLFKAGISSGTIQQVMVKDRTFAAVRLSARVFASGGESVGLIARRADPETYYFATLVGRYSPKFQIELVRDRQRTVLASFVPDFQPQYPDNYRLEFTLDGPKLQLAVDGIRRLEVVDSTLTAGAAGIGTSLPEVDDFKLERQDGIP